MRSARSLFNSAVFWKTVKRFWPIWALYAFVWVLRMPGRMISASAQALRDDSWYAVTAASETAMWLCPAAALAAALAVFSHLYSERSANFYAALPVGRRAMFISCAAAVASSAEAIAGPDVRMSRAAVSAVRRSACRVGASGTAGTDVSSLP